MGYKENTERYNNEKTFDEIFLTEDEEEIKRRANKANDVVKMMVIKTNSTFIYLIDKPSYTMQFMAVEQSLWAIQHIKNPFEGVQDFVVSKAIEKKDYNFLKCCKSEEFINEKYLIQKITNFLDNNI